MIWSDDHESVTLHREEYNEIMGRQRSLQDALDRRAGLERRLAKALGVDPEAPSDEQVRVALATVRRLRRVERAAARLLAHVETRTVLRDDPYLSAQPRTWPRLCR